MPFNPTTNTWQQLANKQSYDEFSAGNLNSSSVIANYDPIYNKLIERISKTMYRKLRITQNWENLGTTAEENQYPGILRELIMAQRKGQNFPADNATRPTSLGAYDIYDDTIDVRYHSAQMRWMYAWTIYDEELRRFSGGNGTTIGELAEMKLINAINARNRFMDNLRKETLSTLANDASTASVTLPDITDFSTLTQADAQAWLNAVDNILFEFKIGSAAYNADNYYIQTPKSEIQMVIPREFYMNVVRKAFPDVFNPEAFQNILPENLILIDTLGGDELYEPDPLDPTTPVPVTPTWDSVGTNTTDWDASTSTFESVDPDRVAVIMHRGCIGFEDNLTETLFAQKDIEKLATPARSHFWTKAYYTDLLPCVVVKK